MLSTSLKRALLDTRWSLPPTYLLPWIATIDQSATFIRPEGISRTSAKQDKRGFSSHARIQQEHAEALKRSSAQQPHDGDPLQKLPSPSATRVSKESISTSVRELLPLLHAQGQHYITTHIHGFPYLVTQGDTVRLPFLMHGVQPGDVLRLTCASYLGSRDYTFKASAASSPFASGTTTTMEIVDETSGTHSSHSRIETSPDLSSALNRVPAPHYIPHIAKGKISYIDDRFYVCRATVMGVESEPMRIKEKTKRRQRRVKTVKSKHRYTILKIKELRIRTIEEVEAAETD